MNQNPTKGEEIAALRTLADQYPVDSYLGSFLRQLTPIVEQAIRSDLIPADPVGTLKAWRQAQQNQALDDIRTEIAALREQKQQAEAELAKAQGRTNQEIQRLQKIRASAAHDLEMARKFVTGDMI